MLPLDDFSEVVDVPLRRLWPLAARLAPRLKGRLMGGTALALHLRHRPSEDLDIMTFMDFSGSNLKSRMKRHIAAAYGSQDHFDIRVLTAEQGGYFALMDGVKLDVFQARKSESVTAPQMRWLTPPIIIEGVPVGTVPDILASKLDVIMYRPKLRDYIDLASIDRLTPHTLELGIEYYKRKYRYDLHPRPGVIRRIVDLIESPGQVQDDERFEHLREETLTHLERRAPEIRDFIDASADQYDPHGAPATAWRDRIESGSKTNHGKPQCGQWMPRARTFCVLPSQHGGPHRSKI